MFRDESHARNAYEKAKRDERPKTPAQMRDAWVADVERRILEAAVGGDE